MHICLLTFVTPSSKLLTLFYLLFCLDNYTVVKGRWIAILYLHSCPVQYSYKVYLFMNVFSVEYSLVLHPSFTFHLLAWPLTRPTYGQDLLTFVSICQQQTESSGCWWLGKGILSHRRNSSQRRHGYACGSKRTNILLVPPSVLWRDDWLRQSRCKLTIIQFNVTFVFWTLCILHIFSAPSSGSTLPVSVLPRNQRANGFVPSARRTVRRNR